MNDLTIIGNVCNDPDVRVTANGVDVCNFRVAVNKIHKKDAPPDFFRVTTWRKDAESCGKYVKKGMKVAVKGSVSLYQYEYKGEHRAELQVDATDVEFLTRVDSAPNDEPPEVPDEAPDASGFTPVDTDELPF